MMEKKESKQVSSTKKEKAPVHVEATVPPVKTASTTKPARKKPAEEKPMTPAGEPQKAQPTVKPAKKVPAEKVPPAEAAVKKPAQEKKKK